MIEKQKIDEIPIISIQEYLKIEIIDGKTKTKKVCINQRMK